MGNSGRVLAHEKQDGVLSTALEGKEMGTATLMKQ